MAELIRDNTEELRRDRIAVRVVQSVAEIPGHDSPEDQPEMMLVTGPELLDIVRRALEIDRDEHHNEEVCATIGYVGVENGTPKFRNVADERGDDCKEISVYQTAEDALNRYFNVRRVRLVVDPEPLRHPEDWGAIDG